MPTPNNQLTPQEIAVMQMALDQMISDLKECASNPKLPFNPEARQHMRDILRNAESAHAKLAAVSGHLIQLDPFNPDDMAGFMTKES
jgi:hypothetical protein